MSSGTHQCHHNYCPNFARLRHYEHAKSEWRDDLNLSAMCVYIVSTPVQMWNTASASMFYPLMTPLKVWLATCLMFFSSLISWRPTDLFTKVHMLSLCAQRHFYLKWNTDERESNLSWESTTKTFGSCVWYGIGRGFRKCNVGLYWDLGCDFVGQLGLG